MAKNEQKNPTSIFRGSVPIAGFNSARLVKGNPTKGYFQKRRAEIDRSEIRRGIRELSDRHIGMLLTMPQNSANRHVCREGERELSKRHNGKVIIEL